MEERRERHVVPVEDRWREEKVALNYVEVEGVGGMLEGDERMLMGGEVWLKQFTVEGRPGRRSTEKIMFAL